MDGSVLWDTLLLPAIGLGAGIGAKSTSIGNVGIGVKTVSGSSLFEVIDASTSYNTVVNKISSVPSTPKVIPCLPGTNLLETISSYHNTVNKLSSLPSIPR